MAAVDVSPPNYMALNTFTLLFCCFVFGIVGIVYSFKVWKFGGLIHLPNDLCSHKG